MYRTCTAFYHAQRQSAGSVTKEAAPVGKALPEPERLKVPQKTRDKKRVGRTQKQKLEFVPLSLWRKRRGRSSPPEKTTRSIAKDEKQEQVILCTGGKEKQTLQYRGGRKTVSCQ